VASYASVILAEPALAGYWKFNEPSGTTANDSSPSPVNGTYVNTPTFGIASPIVANTPGETAVSFARASSEEVTIPDNAKFDFTTGWTIECWVLPATTPASGEFYTVFAKLAAAISNGDYDFSYTNAAGVFEIQPEMHNGSIYNTPVNLGGALSTAVWTHLACTWNGSVVGTYRNGVVVGTPGAKSGAMTANANSMHAGRYGTGTDYWNGGLAHLALYNAALTSTALLNHYTTGTTSDTAPAIEPRIDFEPTRFGPF